MEVLYKNDISVVDYNNLRKSVGWNVIEENQALTGIKNSFYLIVAIVNNKTVGMARIISDGSYIAIIVDVIVLPEYQKNGIGKTMMKKVMDFLNNSIKQGQGLFINLMSAKNKESFYQQFGFESRPNENAGCGMTQWIHK